MTVGKYEIWRSNGRWYWHLIARNGEIVCASESYTRKSSCLRGVEAHRRLAVTACVVELS